MRELRKTHRIRFRQRLDVVPNPSQVSAKSFNSKVLTSFDLHLSSLLENRMQNDAMRSHHSHLPILYEVFRIVPYSLMAAVDQLQLNLEGLGSYENLRNP